MERNKKKNYMDAVSTLEYHKGKQKKHDAHPLRKVIDISQTILVILIIGTFAYLWIYNFTIVQLLAITGGFTLYFLFMLIFGYYIRHADDRKRHILHKLLSKDKD